MLATEGMGSKYSNYEHMLLCLVFLTRVLEARLFIPLINNTSSRKDFKNFIYDI